MTQTWVVFGATSDIATSTCMLSAEGNCFILVGRNAENLARVAERLVNRGARSTGIHVVDLSNHEALLSLLRNLGTKDRATHILIAQGQLMNSAQVLGDYESAMTMVRVNALSALTIMSWASTKRKVQWVVVLSSVAGDRGRADNHLYGASKAALDTYVDGALMLERGPKWLLVKPGPVDSKMTKHLTPNFLWTTPDDVAKTINGRISKGREGVVYSPWYWCLIMKMIRLLPTSIVRLVKN